MDELDEQKYRALTSVLAYRHSTLSKYYALCIAIADKVPLQLPNEIRNAFAHLSRVSIATNPDDVEKEARKARDHLERASRDCLKLSLIVIQEKVDKILTTALVAHKCATHSFNARLKAIKEQRRAILIKEEAGDEDLVETMEGLLNEAIALEEEIIAQFGALKSNKVIIFFRKYFFPLALAVFAIVGVLSDMVGLASVVGIEADSSSQVKSE